MNDACHPLSGVTNGVIEATHKARQLSQPSADKIKFDLSNKRFGHWMVIAIHPERYRRKNRKSSTARLWLCRCDCGTKRVVFDTHLRTGRSKSCGCAAFLPRTHGLSKSRAYAVWSSMKQRCLNPRHHSYDNYGGRGISVCQQWLRFENFYADMLDPPPGLSIERINNDGDYEPGNCCWADRAQQARNQRPGKKRTAVRQGKPVPSSLDVDPPF
jgi:hypothetical protein